MPTGETEKVSATGERLKLRKRQPNSKSKRSWVSAQKRGAGSDNRSRPRAVHPANNARQRQEGGENPHRRGREDKADGPDGGTSSHRKHGDSVVRNPFTKQATAASAAKLVSYLHENYGAPNLRKIIFTPSRPKPRKVTATA
jgi:hypothetical protein